MTTQTALILLLLLLVGAASLVLFLDARQRRMDRHIATAIAISAAQEAVSIRRTRAAQKVRLLHRLVNYRPGITYLIRPRYVLLFGLIPVAAIFYANKFLDFPTIHVAIAALVAALFAVRGVFGWQRHRLATQLFRQLPDAIELVVGAVRSGLPVGEAFRSIAREMPEPTAGQFAVAVSEMGLGAPLEDALEGIRERTGVAEYGFFAVTLAVQTKAGGNLSETLRTLSDTVRQRVTLAARAKAMAGEVIFSSRALSLAPWIIGGGLYLLNPRLVDLLFTDPTGKRLLAYAIVSVIIGSLVISWMVRRNTAI